MTDTNLETNIRPRQQLPENECETMRLPRETCGCPQCGESRYPDDMVESDGGEL